MYTLNTTATTPWQQHHNINTWCFVYDDALREPAVRRNWCTICRILDQGKGMVSPNQCSLFYHGEKYNISMTYTCGQINKAISSVKQNQNAT